MASLKGKKILVGVSGGIAAYKACELVRRLVESLGGQVAIESRLGHGTVFRHIAAQNDQMPLRIEWLLPRMDHILPSRRYVRHVAQEILHRLTGDGERVAVQPTVRQQDLPDAQPREREGGPDAEWQGQLWRELAGAIETPHRAALLRAFFIVIICNVFDLVELEIPHKTQKLLVAFRLLLGINPFQISV